MSIANPHINASNEQATNILIANDYAKAYWQTVRMQYGVKVATKQTADKYNTTQSAVKAASWYW